MAKGREQPEGDGPRRSAAARKAFLLRLPPDLHEQIRVWAAQELRSLNGQIEFLLREAVKKRGGEEE